MCRDVYLYFNLFRLVIFDIFFDYKISEGLGRMSGSTVSSRSSSSSTSSRRYSNGTPASSVTSSGRPRGYRGGGHEVCF